MNLIKIQSLRDYLEKYYCTLVIAIKNNNDNQKLKLIKRLYYK